MQTELSSSAMMVQYPCEMVDLWLGLVFQDFSSFPSLPFLNPFPELSTQKLFLH